MKKSKISRSVKKKLITKSNLLLLAVLLAIVILIVGIRFFSNSQAIIDSVPLTGLVTDNATNETSVLTDVTVWQGQYYIGDQFQKGTFEFNFTVYDASIEGNKCYSNLTMLTTGSFGEWITEQTEVGAACNDASKNYYLEIVINDEIQGPRKLLKSFDYIRKDTSEITKSLEVRGSINATGEVCDGSGRCLSQLGDRGNPFDQNLNTTDNPSFVNISVANTGFFLYLGDLTNRVTSLFVQKIDVSNSIKFGFTILENCNSTTEGTIVYAAGNGNKREFWGCRQENIGVYEWEEMS